jgi:hypothetical protein
MLTNKMPFISGGNRDLVVTNNILNIAKLVTEEILYKHAI